MSEIVYIEGFYRNHDNVLPVSQEMLTSENDIPPSEHNFFFFFSGHTFILDL